MAGAHRCGSCPPPTVTIKDSDRSGLSNLSSKVAVQTWSGLIQYQQRRFGKSADAATKVRRARA